MGELLPILHGYCTIQLRRKIGGANRHPHTIKWDLCPCGNVLVDARNFKAINQYIWLRHNEPRSKSYYAYRQEKRGNKRIKIFMGREILGLPHGVGFGSGVEDHKNHDIRDDTEENLRVATQAQNIVNSRKHGYCQRFKGVIKNRTGDQYETRIAVNSSRICFTSVPTDVEAALMYNYAAYLIYGEHAELNWILDKEMLTEERQWELYYMVLDKLKKKGFSVAA